jgi:hypothetical protein
MRQGALIAVDLLLELERPGVDEQCSIDPAFRTGPQLDPVGAALRRAQAAGPAAVEGFTRILSAAVADAYAGGVVDAGSLADLLRS